MMQTIGNQSHIAKSLLRVGTALVLDTQSRCQSIFVRFAILEVG